ESDRWGMDCQHECTCRNGGICDRVSGACVCPEGYQGVSCQDLCSPGTYGSGCRQKCLCNNGALCKHDTGVCICPLGYHGPLCENSYWGEECANVCDCENE
ncbi:unnamed protein product, partial [Meganyctiphanes norvegica]